MKIIKKIIKCFKRAKREETCILRYMCANHVEHCEKCNYYVESNK